MFTNRKSNTKEQEKKSYSKYQTTQWKNSKWNRQASPNKIIDKIAALFPSVITETKDADGNLKKAINFDTLKQLLSEDVVDGDECYEFTWVGKKQSIIDGNRPIRKTLRPCPEESKNWNKTENLYIEGDNLEVLKLLQGSYLNAVKMIYIDPPYNTGKDFVYRDNFTAKKDDYEADLGLYDEDENRLFQNSESNGRFHSDWCSMIYPRLQLARNLLTDDGVIFISIDDNEVDNLKKVCDEVFGESNFQGLVSRLTGTPTGGGNKAIVNEVDFILIYSKSINCTIEGAPLTEEEEKIYDKIDENGRYLTRSLRRTGGEDRREDRPTMYYPILAPDGTEIYPIGPTGYESRWICGKDKLNEMLKQGLVHFQLTEKENEKKWQVMQKFYLEGRLKQPSNLWKNLEGNKKATREVKDIFDSTKVFDYPKPVDLVKYMLKLASQSDSIILDFFSGSATTAHSVMRLNAEDGGNRKFIMVQLPENCDENNEAYKAGYKNICEIGKERIRRAGNKIDDELLTKSNNGGLFEKEEKTIDTGFRVLKLDSSNMKDVYYGAGEYSQQMLLDLESNIKDDRTDLDLLYGVLLDWGVPLSLPHTTETIEGVRVHFVNDVDLVACFAEKVTETVIREIAKRKPLRVVFRDSSFANSPDKINVTEIFKILSGETTVKVI